MDEVVFLEDFDPVCGKCSHFRPKNVTTAKRPRSAFQYLKASN
jgi:hypothetical protein